MEKSVETVKIIIKEVPSDKAIIVDDFIVGASGCGGTEILQSSVWLKISKAASGSSSTRIFQATCGDQVVASLLVVEKIVFGLFKYLYSPRGPIFQRETSDQLRADIVKAFAAKFSDKKIFVFWRLEPEKKLPLALRKTIDLQPKKTLLLDLSKKEDELLKEMHQKTRYNIRLAEKKGVLVLGAAMNLEGNDFASDFDDFWRLMKKTSNRDSFGIHGREHYLFLLTAGSPVIRLYFAEYDGKRIAAGLFSFFGGKATYLHGASDDDYKNLMAPYALQFDVIKQARSEGCQLYDFYGIDENKWPGVTRFKKGFGGFEHEYAGTYDLMLRPVGYFIYTILRKLRRLKIW